MTIPTSSSRLAGKISLITGGSSGIGLSTAARFLQQGARVVITGRNAAGLQQAIHELNHPMATGHEADAAEPVAMEKLYRTVHEAFGPIHVLFLNAGIAPIASLEETTEVLFDAIFATNVKGVFFGVQKALPYLADGASVVINSSAVSQKGMPGFIAYSATKAAVRNFARGMSNELAPRKIRVNCISPGPIGTPLWGKTGLSDAQMQAAGEQLLKTFPAGRFGSSDEVADAVLYLASDESKFVVGADLCIDGGIAQI